MSVLSLIPEERKKCFPSTESVYNSNSLKFPCALRKRKILHPLLSSSTMLTLSSSNSYKGGDKTITKRVLSAKEHRLKNLQNQLADAHFHLSELSNENRLLRSLQKRQDSALQRYENSNGDIPKLINSHTEELRSWQVRYKHLRSQSREINQRLKDKDVELQHINDEHKHLVALSKDLNLGEREKLKNQVQNLNDKVNQQNETISGLHRKIRLEAKNLRHQLSTEKAKHRDTQQQLNEALSNSERLSSLVEMKEKIIASNVPKRVLPKLLPDSQNVMKAPLDCFNMNILKSQLTGLDLSVKGSSIAESQATYSSSKSIGSARSTFTINRRFAENHIDEELHNNHMDTVQDTYNSRRQSTKTENDSSAESNTYDNDLNDYGLAKAIRDGMPDMKIFESDTDIPRSSDEDVKERVDTMKRQLSKQIRKASSSETSLNRNHSSREKSSSDNDRESIEETKNRIYINNSDSERNMVHKKRIMSPNLAQNISADDESIETENEKRDKSSRTEIEMSLQKLDELNETWDELEQNALFQNREAETILETYCNDVVRKANNSHSVPREKFSMTDQYKKLNSVHEVIDEKSDPTNNTMDHGKELNNNSKPISRKMSTELNDEKKKRLLAAFKAIDRGDEDGLNIDILKKSKIKSKSLSTYGKK